MENKICIACQTAKSIRECVSCREPLCKACPQFADESTFDFFKSMPAGLEAGSYCPQCFETRVRPEIEAYEQKLERARNMNVFLKKQGKEVVHLRRAQFPVKVENCEDRDEAILRLAFLAAEEGYDTIIGVDLTTTKVRDNSYQKTLWSGVGTPAEGRKKKSQS